MERMEKVKDYSVKNGNSYVSIGYHDDEFHVEQDPETGDETEVYDEFFKIEHVYVSPETRGKGFAKQMIRDAVEAIRADFPETRIMLAALPTDDEPVDQEGLVALYQKCGFKVVDGQEGCPAVVMEYRK